MLCHGSVRVAKSARTGKAVVRVEMPASSDYRSFATDIPVEIVEQEYAVKLPPGTDAWVVESIVEPIEGNWNGLWRLLPRVRS